MVIIIIWNIFFRRCVTFLSDWDDNDDDNADDETEFGIDIVCLSNFYLT